MYTSPLRASTSFTPTITQVNLFSVPLELAAQRAPAPPPQLFHVGMPVVLDGHWQGPFFASFQIMVQHGSTYVEAHPGPAKSAARN